MNIRKKGKWANGEPKFVIEENGRYIETLPKVDELLKRLRLDITSQNNGEKVSKTNETVPKDSYNIDYTNDENKTDADKLMPTRAEFEDMYRRLMEKQGQ